MNTTLISDYRLLWISPLKELNYNIAYSRDCRQLVGNMVQISFYALDKYNKRLGVNCEIEKEKTRT